MGERKKKKRELRKEGPKWKEDEAARKPND